MKSANHKMVDGLEKQIMFVGFMLNSCLATLSVQKYE